MTRPHNGSSEHQYLRLLKRRQRTSLWLERLACLAMLLALMCFLDDQVAGAGACVSLVWWLGIGCLFLALVLIVVEALDAAYEQRQRQKRIVSKKLDTL